jgi:hypothetical protein
MSDYEARLIREELDLNAKLIKLREFLATERCEHLPRADRELLGLQLIAMSQYQKILLSRLERLDS